MTWWLNSRSIDIWGTSAADTGRPGVATNLAGQRRETTTKSCDALHQQNEGFQ